MEANCPSYKAAVSENSCPNGFPNSPQMFINEESFIEWKKNSIPSECSVSGPYKLKCFTGARMPINKNSTRGSLSNPIELTCSNAELLYGCKWNSVRISNTLNCSLIMPPKLAKPGDILFFSGGLRDYYCIIQSGSYSSVEELISVEKSSILSESSVGVPYKLKRFTGARMPINKNSTRGSLSNPIELTCSNAELLYGCKWNSVRISNTLNCSLIMPPKLAKPGDILFFSGGLRDYYCVIQRI